MELRGETVLLRPFIEGDVEAVAKIHAEPGVARWWGRPEIDKLRRKAEGTEGSTACLLMELLADDLSANPSGPKPR